MCVSMRDEVGCMALHLLPPEKTWIDYFKLFCHRVTSYVDTTQLCAQSLSQTKREDTVLWQGTSYDTGMGFCCYYFSSSHSDMHHVR